MDVHPNTWDGFGMSWTHSHTKKNANHQKMKPNTENFKPWLNMRRKEHATWTVNRFTRVTPFFNVRTTESFKGSRSLILELNMGFLGFPRYFFQVCCMGLDALDRLVQYARLPVPCLPHVHPMANVGLRGRSPTLAKNSGEPFAAAVLHQVRMEQAPGSGLWKFRAFPSRCTSSIFNLHHLVKGSKCREFSQISTLLDSRIALSFAVLNVDLPTRLAATMSQSHLQQRWYTVAT